MRNIMKVLLILVIVLGLLALVGCQDQETTVDNGATTVPQETTGEVAEETTTEKPVNIVEDPLGNGEGDPLDAIDGTTDESGPVIDIEIDDDGGNSTADPTQGGSTGGNSEDNVTEPTAGGDSDDDLVVDFDDLVNGKK